jgi:hypothetical protein
MLDDCNLCVSLKEEGGKMGLAATIQQISKLVHLGWKYFNL